MSVCECLRVLGGLSGAGFAGFIGIFRMGEDLLTQVGSDGVVCERLREITSVCECLRVLGGLSGAGFAGFIGIFRMGEDLLTRCARTRDERLRAFTRASVCECLRVLGGLSGAGFAGFFLAFTRDHERLRVFTSVGRIVWSRICRIYWDFQDGGGPADAGALVRALDERLRAFTRDHERLRVFSCVYERLVWLAPMGRPRNGKNKLHPDGCGLLCAEYEGLLGWCSMVGPLMRPGEAGFPLNGLLSW